MAVSWKEGGSNCNVKKKKKISVPLTLCVGMFGYIFFFFPLPCYLICSLATVMYMMYIKLVKVISRYEISSLCCTILFLKCHLPRTWSDQGLLHRLERLLTLGSDDLHVQIHLSFYVICTQKSPFFKVILHFIMLCRFLSQWGNTTQSRSLLFLL